MSRPSVSRALIAISIVSLALAVAMAFGASFSLRIGGLRLRGADEMRPLIVAAVAAWIGVLVGGAGRARRLGIGLGALACVEIVALTFVRAGGQQYSVGDAAFLELYTLHVTRGIWPFGPYSQFGWHHPGPLYFYLLAPLYAAGGFRFVGMNVGAAIINLGWLVLLLGIVGRHGRRSTVIFISIAVGVYVLRLARAFVSAWNPHVLPLPMGALVIVSAALAAGQLWLAPVSVIVGSFCVQTHVGLGPSVVALWGFAAVSVAVQARRGEIRPEAARRWLNIATWTAVACWLLPLAEELDNRPGNLTTILRFFLGPAERRPFLDAFVIWAEMMSGLVTNGLTIPVGRPLPTTPSAIPIEMAMGQVALLAFLAARPGHGDRRFERSLAAAGLLSAVIALWSASQITVLIGDYHVFWMSMIGALNWAVLAGTVTVGLFDRLLKAPPQRLAVVICPLLIAALAYVPIRTLVMAQRHAASGDRRGRQIKAAADAIAGDMSVHVFRRALVHGGTGAWGEHGGVVVELYKRRVPIAVASGSVFMYGRPLAANGQEQVEYFVHRTRAHAPAKDRPGAEVILRRADVTVTRRACDGPDPVRPCLADR